MARIEALLAALATMTPAQLQEAWRNVYGTDAPRLSPDLLHHGIAYRLQERAGKSLSASAQRQLRAPNGGDPAPARLPVTLSAGTQLVRTWHGRTISVTVEGDGYRYEGRRYNSLTSIAREITGAAWSGPRFFGLTGKRAA
ncbi:DUF2924 domain-containing protein [Sphingomonas flavalba]|uniref:DUF2924 domain-containing protein n=1 Tax=Sphingomonas flavalba TaxID=2559804 RepID=UPI00109D9EC6|nr:DUF2924 domain-containing protein [Sphingomonas flavalba]